MHELSLALEIVEIVKEETQRANAIAVTKLVLDIGTLSGVEIDALQFAMAEAVKDSVLESTEIVYQIIEAKAVCEECCNEFDTNDHFTICPVCNSNRTNFIKGKELKIRSIEIEQE